MIVRQKEPKISDMYFFCVVDQDSGYNSTGYSPYKFKLSMSSADESLSLDIGLQVPQRHKMRHEQE